MVIEIKLDPKYPVILIDTSYYMFHRYFSTLKWYQFSHKDINYQTLHNDIEFITALDKHVIADLKKLCKQWKTKISNVVFCYDCSRENIWRNSITTDYKATRIANAKYNPSIFSHLYSLFENTLKKEQNVNIVNLDHLEADDIVYMCKKALIEKSFSELIIIITNDSDYLQILDSQTKIYNLIGKGIDISKRSCYIENDTTTTTTATTTTTVVNLDLKLKIILGDKSDNIKPINTTITPKKALELALLPDSEFENYLKETQCEEQYYHNKRLVDFTMIPSEYHKLFSEKYTIVYS